MKIKDITRIGTLAILAAMISMVEVMVTPLIPIPGMRLGFSNIVILVALIHLKSSHVFAIITLKSTLAAIFSGSITSFLYSFPAGILAAFVMKLAMRLMPKYSYIGVSAIGALFNNITQVMMSIIVLKSNVYLYYLPYITLVGTLTGSVIGVIINELERKKILRRIINEG
ncbi:MAG: Gx transporter family protein [Ezakiella sp.]|nr:Gx transporter family protein [Ezakiella sp.]MDD7761321.1 Gx transporter family protein [Bacillota bacterium]MDY3947132.1 Gx transporter family protein [Ezakiella sp.]